MSATPSSNSSNNHHQSSSTDPKTLCRYFASNICYKGENCEFSHDRNARPEMTCRYYLQGHCAYGSACRYDHVRQRKEVPTTKSGMSSSEKPKETTNSRDSANSLSTPKIASKLSANSKPFIPKTWNQPDDSPLNTFQQNMVQGLELINSQQNMVPCSSWAQIVGGGETTSSQAPPMTIAEIPLCPYFEVGFCLDGELCCFVHGTTCEMCGLNVLHPHNENQRKTHHRECLAEHEKQMEAAFAEAKSAEMQCGICMEQIVEKGLRFGILQNCAHCYCLECIRKWRKHEDEQIKTKTKRSCPQCRVHSDYVIPSKVWVDEVAEKEKLVKIFHENTKKIQCKFVKGTDVDKCPFGSKCFYKHQLPDGTIAEGKSPNALRKERRQRVTLLDIAELSWLYSSGYDDDDDTDDFDDDDDELDTFYDFFLR